MTSDFKKNQKNKYIPYGRQSIDMQDIEAVINVLKSDYLTTGPVIERFEQAIADYVGAQYAVAFSSGTAALHGACFAAGIGIGDEVITSPMTFAASANCILYQGGTPVFADVDPITGNIDPEAIHKAITPKTKAIIPVHYTGRPVNLDEIHEIARKHNLIVIEDAAHALGAKYKGKKVGALSDMTMFSFHPVKHITTGEGGMITTNSKDYYEKLIQFRAHGITRNSDKLQENHGPWYYEMQFLGFNYRMTDIQAALGISQLNKLDNFIQKRREIVKKYHDAFKDLAELDILYDDDNQWSSWHIYVIKLNSDKLNKTREEIFANLRDESIGVNVHYIPVYFHPYYKNLGYRKGLCPKAEVFYKKIITLPLFPSLQIDEVNKVINVIKSIIKN